MTNNPLRPTSHPPWPVVPHLGDRGHGPRSTVFGMDIATPQGPAEVTLDEPENPAFLLVMTHGSNGGVDAPDLLAVRAEALALGGAVARVLQPFRRAGRRAPGSAARQDEAWLAVIAELRERFPDVPLIQC